MTAQTTTNVLVTRQVARTLRPIESLTTGSIVPESEVRALCHDLAVAKTSATMDAIATAPLGSRVAINGFAGMPEGTVFYATEIKGTGRARLQTSTNPNTTFDTCSTRELTSRANNICIRTSAQRDDELRNLANSYDDDAARREAKFLKACGLKA